MRHAPALGLAAATMMALAGCTGGGGGVLPSAPATASASASATAAARVYSEDELRAMISGLRDTDGNELKLYSKEQVDQGGTIAGILLGTATVNPGECKDIATAGLLDSVESGEIAVAISEGDRPRTVSAQSGREGPDAVQLLQDISDTMDRCATFSVEAMGQRYEVTSEELQARTQAEETFATLSKRSGDSRELMQVSAAEGRLLVVATKSGPDLGDSDQKELEALIDQVLRKAEGGTTAAASATGTPSSRATASPTSGMTATPTPTTSGTLTPSPSASR